MATDNDNDMATDNDNEMATDNDIDQQIAITHKRQFLWEGTEEARISLEKKSEASLNERSEHDKRERLIARSIDCMTVSENMYDCIFPNIEYLHQYLESSIPPEDRRTLRKMLSMREFFARRAFAVSLENRKLDETISAKKIQLKNSIKKRNELWNKAVKVFNGVSAKSRNPPIISEEYDTSEGTESSSSVSEDYKAKNISPEKMRKEIQEKYLFIQEISGILHRLIVSSGIKWAQQKNLLDIVLCTGKILNTTFNKHNAKEFEKFINDCMQRLNQVNWKHIH